MISDTFYFGTTKSIIAAFGIMFSDIKYKDDYGKIITCPLHYSAKEKFILLIQNETYQPGLDIEDIALPRMGFELKSIRYDSMRMLNPVSKIRDSNDEEETYMFNRVPYIFDFNLYIGTRKFEDSLKIIEQIAPFFTPELNISIRDKVDFGIVTDVPITLNDINFEIEWADDITLRRSILWTLTFTAKAWLYSNVRELIRIKEVILNMGDQDFDRVYDTFISEVEPRTAKRSDDYVIVTHGPGIVSSEYYLNPVGSGETLLFDFDFGDYAYWLYPKVVGSGEYAIVEIITPQGPVTNFRFKCSSGETASVGTIDNISSYQWPFRCKASSGERASVEISTIQNIGSVASSGEKVLVRPSWHERMF